MIQINTYRYAIYPYKKPKLIRKVETTEKIQDKKKRNEWYG